MINQIFIKFHDNDYWFHLKHALKCFANWYFYYTESSEKTSFESVEKYIRASIDNLSYLTQGKFETFYSHNRLNIYFNEEAIRMCEEEMKNGNFGECAYLDVESYLMSDGESLDKYIMNI